MAAKQVDKIQEMIRAEKIQEIRLAWKALRPEDQLTCLLGLVREWGYYGQFLEKPQSETK